MGSVVFEIGEILSSRGNIKAKKLKHGGTLFCRVKQKNINATGNLILSLKGVKLKNVDGVLSKSDPFFEISTQADDAGGYSWQPVYRSEVIKNDLSPVWKECSIPLQKLCSGDADRPVLIEVMDWNKRGKRKPMGRIESSVRGLTSAVGRTMPLMHRGKKYGEILLEKASTLGGLASDTNQRFINVLSLIHI